ncbi:transposase [Mesomycoplasma ovipneumoniae]|uniref:transposase n=1 Tax=Mesomycoplasma ovipneumoniae TaxID=29562 RepID=UPI002965CC20|nr:transposase [Mesomycoplasma ovipneumoniae]
MHRSNKRNGFSVKTVNYKNDNIRLKIPRDRNGTFENKLIGKYEKNLGDTEEQCFRFLHQECHMKILLTQ